jgi:hypothetical protein
MVSFQSLGCNVSDHFNPIPRVNPLLLLEKDVSLLGDDEIS